MGHRILIPCVSRGPFLAVSFGFVGILCSSSCHGSRILGFRIGTRERIRLGFLNRTWRGLIWLLREYRDGTRHHGLLLFFAHLCGSRQDRQIYWVEPRILCLPARKIVRRDGICVTASWTAWWTAPFEGGRVGVLCRWPEEAHLKRERDEGAVWSQHS